MGNDSPSVCSRPRLLTWRLPPLLSPSGRRRRDGAGGRRGSEAAGRVARSSLLLAPRSEGSAPLTGRIPGEKGRPHPEPGGFAQQSASARRGAAHVLPGEGRGGGRQRGSASGRHTTSPAAGEGGGRGPRPPGGKGCPVKHGRSGSPVRKGPFVLSLRHGFHVISPNSWNFC